MRCLKGHNILLCSHGTDILSLRSRNSSRGKSLALGWPFQVTPAQKETRKVVSTPERLMVLL